MRLGILPKNMTPKTYIETVLPKMEGWCSPEKAKRLADLTTEYSVTKFVEIGVFAGRSLFSVALAQNSINGAISVGIDPWCSSDSVKGFADENSEWWRKIDHEKIYNECRRLQSALGLDDHCFLIRANARQAFPIIKTLSPIDMLHIDGNHSEEESCFDVDNYYPLVRSGGVILFDDSDWITTKKAVEKLDALSKRLDPVGSCLVFAKP